MTKTTLLFSMILLLLAQSSPMARSLQEIRDSGTLNVGVAKAIPWVMSNAKGDLMGSEIDVASLLVSELGVEEKVTVLEWSELIPALQKGNIDVIISGMSITPRRALKVDFTQPYGESEMSLLARRDSPAGKASDIEAMNQASVKIGTTAGTISAEVMQQLFYSAQVTELPSIKSFLVSCKRATLTLW
jgi:polar amino acid transport system substrate-binding protein